MPWLLREELAATFGPAPGLDCLPRFGSGPMRGRDDTRSRFVARTPSSPRWTHAGPGPGPASASPGFSGKAVLEVASADGPPTRIIDVPSFSRGPGTRGGPGLPGSTASRGRDDSVRRRRSFSRPLVVRRRVRRSAAGHAGGSAAAAAGSGAARPGEHVRHRRRGARSAGALRQRTRGGAS